MHGNVAEWVLDATAGTANYPSGLVVDPIVADGASRLARGGSRLTFTCAGGKVTMAFDRAALHRMLQMLGRTSERAGWSIPLPWQT